MLEQEFSDKIKGLCPALYRTAYMCLGNEDLALDAVDETVFRALASPASALADGFENRVTLTLLEVCREALSDPASTACASKEPPEGPTPLKLDFALDRATARRAKLERSRRARRAARAPILTFLAVFALFAALTSWYPPFAEACRGVPVIGELSEAVSSGVEYIEQSFAVQE